MVIYIYSYIAFLFFRDTFVNNDEEEGTSDVNNYCDSLIYCFTSTLNNGLRSGGGIGDVLQNLVRTNEKYWQRYVYDLTFFMIIIIIMLNLVFGIIIDAFADMRDDRNSIEEDIQDKCFICGISRFDFEIKNKSWFDHVKIEHNVYSYLYYILYVW